MSFIRPAKWPLCSGVERTRFRPSSKIRQRQPGYLRQSQGKHW